MDEDIKTFNDHQKAKYLDKIKHYCAYRDRCHKEVIDKLFKMNVPSDMADEIISELVTEGFLNEERFVLAYVRGKFRMNKWGKNKIKLELKQKEISNYLIKLGMKEIDDNDYYKTLSNLLIAKRNTFKAKNQYDLFNKLYGYAYRKGYESELIKNVIEDIV